eukprot:scaffold5532_cov263-Pinguiococcus_pyrenoidosus.AAC.1
MGDWRLRFVNNEGFLKYKGSNWDTKLWPLLAAGRILKNCGTAAQESVARRRCPCANCNS